MKLSAMYNISRQGDIFVNTHCRFPSTMTMIEDVIISIQGWFVETAESLRSNFAAVKQSKLAAMFILELNFWNFLHILAHTHHSGWLHSPKESKRESVSLLDHHCHWVISYLGINAQWEALAVKKLRGFSWLYNYNETVESVNVIRLLKFEQSFLTVGGEWEINVEVSKILLIAPDLAGLVVFFFPHLQWRAPLYLC